MLDSKVNILDSNQNNIQNSEMKDSFYYNMAGNDCHQFNSGCSNKNNNSIHFDKSNECGVANMKLLNSPGTPGNDKLLFSGFFGQQANNVNQNINVFSTNFMPIQSEMTSNTIVNTNTYNNTNMNNNNNNHANKGIEFKKFIEVVKAPILTDVNQKEKSKIYRKGNNNYCYLTY